MGRENQRCSSGGSQRRPINNAPYLSDLHGSNGAVPYAWACADDQPEAIERRGFRRDLHQRPEDADGSAHLFRHA